MRSSALGVCADPPDPSHSHRLIETTIERLVAQFLGQENLVLNDPPVHVDHIKGTIRANTHVDRTEPLVSGRKKFPFPPLIVRVEHVFRACLEPLGVELESNHHVSGRLRDEHGARIEALVVSGVDLVLVETAGIGQSDSEIVDMVDAGLVQPKLGIRVRDAQLGRKQVGSAANPLQQADRIAVVAAAGRNLPEVKAK